jgi:hypothetical protein
MRIDRVKPQDIDQSQAIKEVNQYLNDIQEWMSQQTLESFPWDYFKNQAKTLLNKIENVYGFFKRSKKNKAIFKYSSMAAKNAHIQELKYVYTLQALVTKGYAFIQEFRKFLSKEKIDYLIMFDDILNSDSKSQSIGKFSLKDLLPTLNARLTKNNNFSIQINNYKELINLKQKAFQETDACTEKIYNRIINLTNWIHSERKEYVSKTKGTQSGYEIGQAGIAFEIAANEIANVLRNPDSDINMIDIIENKFHADNAVFYQAGDLNKDFVSAIFEDAKDYLLELKRVAIKENAIGARLTGENTVENALKKIINILEKNSIKNEIIEKLEKEFKIKKGQILKKAGEMVVKGVANAINMAFPKA